MFLVGNCGNGIGQYLLIIRNDNKHRMDLAEISVLSKRSIGIKLSKFLCFYQLSDLQIIYHRWNPGRQTEIDIY